MTITKQNKQKGVISMIIYNVLIEDHDQAYFESKLYRKKSDAIDFVKDDVLQSKQLKLKDEDIVEESDEKTIIYLEQHELYYEIRKTDLDDIK